MNRLLSDKFKIYFDDDDYGWVLAYGAVILAEGFVRHADAVQAMDRWARHLGKVERR